MVAGMMTGCGKEESPAATADTASTTEKEKTLTGAVKGVTVDQVEQLKKMALRSSTPAWIVK